MPSLESPLPQDQRFADRLQRDIPFDVPRSYAIAAAVATRIHAKLIAQGVDDIIISFPLPAGPVDDCCTVVLLHSGENGRLVWQVTLSIAAQGIVDAYAGQIAGTQPLTSTSAFQLVDAVSDGAISNALRRVEPLEPIKMQPARLEVIR